MKIRLQLCFVLVYQFTVSFSTSELYCKCFSYNDIFFMTLGLLFCDMFALRMKITLQLRFVFVRHCDVFFITSNLRYLFVRCSQVFENNNNPSTNPFLFLVEISLFSTRAFSKLHFFFFLFNLTY